VGRLWFLPARARAPTPTQARVRDCMKLLLTGANGQLGRELRRTLAPLGEMTCLTRADCELERPEGLRAQVRALRPDVIVNAAAYTAVDLAESHPDPAEAVNARVPAILGEEADRLGALVLHYSTDYVFDGSKPLPYTEDDPPAPLSVYGQTKLRGERALAGATARHLVLRTSWVLGADGNNFARTMLRLAAERETLRVVSDQHGAPTSAGLLARVTLQLLERLARDGAEGFPFGLYHVAAAGETTWCDYARFVVETARALGRPLRLGPDGIEPIATADYPTPARRPLNSRLDTRRLQQTFGIELPHWQEGVRQLVPQLT
jgi:dTDP-4-dehydrorhamnose reductase